MESTIFEFYVIIKFFFDIVIGTSGSSPVLTPYPPTGAHTLHSQNKRFVFTAKDAGGVDRLFIGAGSVQSAQMKVNINHYTNINNSTAGTTYSYSELPTALSGSITYATIDQVKPTNGISNTTVYSDIFPTNRICNQGNGTDVELRVFNPITENTIGSVILSSAYYLTSCPDGFDVGHNNDTGVEDLAFFVSNGNLAILRNNNGTIEWEEIIPDPDPGISINPYDLTFVDQPLILNANNSANNFKYNRIASVNNGGYVYFRAANSTNNDELWISDGTPQGTYMIKDLNTSGASSPSAFTAMNGKLYFIASSNTIDGGLWSTDGTESGTDLIKDFNPGGSSFVGSIKNINNKLYLSINDGIHGSELWISDGTMSGTMMVKDIFPGNGLYAPNSSNPNSFTLMNGLVYFTADDGMHGEELWVTDGTTNGTYMVKNINNIGDGSQGSSVNLSPGLVNGSLLYFYADDGVHGKEIWVTDGTREGTKIAYDLKPGPDHSNEYSQWGQLAGGDLIVGADDGEIGTEIFIFEDIPSSCPSTSLGLKVFLEAAYNTGAMSTSLSEKIPLRQPFNTENWGYYGDETTTSEIISADNIVDWVVIELRNGSSAADSEPIARKAALLKSDGTLIDSDGNTDILFKWVPAGDYYVSVYHRNHLAVMSSQMVNLTSL